MNGAMRKYLFIAMAALAMISCSKAEMTVEKETRTFQYLFSIAEKPSFDVDTKSVKTSWEDGDKIYIVFDETVPKSLEDFMILKYSASAEDWEVVQESTTAPKEEGGTLDALYYGNPDPDGLFEDTTSGGIYYFESDPSQGGRYLYLCQKDAEYIVEDGTVEASISLDFQINNVRTYVQFCITGLEGDWNIMNADFFNSDNGFTVWTPEWQELNKSFQYDGFGGLWVRMNELADGHYSYFSIQQNADEITVTLYKASGENAGIYWKTFSKKISGKSVAVTFKGPQFNSDGVLTNGWNKVGGDGSIGGHSYVDLGGDVLWATMNVGADEILESGDFFAWGETEPHYSSLSPLVWKEGKTGYNFESYSLVESVEVDLGEGPQKLDRYLKYQGTGEDCDGLTTLEAVDDAASFNWGDKWRTPTESEWKWLAEKCSTRVIANDLVVVKSDINDNFVLFTWAGSFAGQSFTPSSYYMSSSLSDNISFFKIMALSGSLIYNAPRYNFGFPVRPVITKE